MNIKSLEEDEFYSVSESVTEGHPDKLCDSISDSILDACLEQDPFAKVACETMAKSNLIVIAGEISTTAKINIDKIVRDRIKEVGYDDESKGLDYKTCEIMIKLTQQSHDISQSVHENKNEEDMGAGDQGIVFGYATNETKECFPFSHLMALRLSERLAEVRKNNTLPWLRPDGKTQVVVLYKNEGGAVVPIRIENILISAQHDPGIKNEEIRSALIENVIIPVIPKEYLNDNTKYLINPSGLFVIGGPEADAGLTGRKTMVDAYGGWGAHGGGAFSGKDPSKVDRSGAYAARWIAKSLVFHKLCKRVLVQIAYSIGISDPLILNIDALGTGINGKLNRDLFNIVINNFNLKPGVIIKELQLKRPIYKKTSTYGHFGRNDPDFTWETPKKLII